jgi:hypothetical protein
MIEDDRESDDDDDDDDLQSSPQPGQNRSDSPSYENDDGETEVGLPQAERMPIGTALPQAAVLCVLDEVALPKLENILITHEVHRWFKFADAKYRALFIRRLKQLSGGERSRILSKRLTGSRHLIYESYLDQDTAQRVLWTECRDRTAPSILIWSVWHKRVSKRMAQIDESLARLNRQVGATTASGTGGIELTDESVLLDPRKNVPLALYRLPSDEIPMLQNSAVSWTPKLRMTGPESAVIEKQGTVLVLGRSGTGKTLCICNRMSRDRHLSAVPGLKQCFVARSKKVRELMRSLQERYCSDEDLSRSRFLKFEDLLRECRQSRDNDNVDAPRPRLFSKSRKVGFQRFKGIYPGLRPKQQLDPLVAWAQIRSYIKGSAEAVGKNGPLSREEYTALGKDRCRLTLEQREEAYETYEAYQRYLKANDCFDDVDEVFDLFLDQLDPREWVYSERASNLRYHKIYVDEVQDYTVAELAVLAMLSSLAIRPSPSRKACRSDSRRSGS